MTTWSGARLVLGGIAAAVCAAAVAPASAATMTTAIGTPLTYALHNMPSTPDGPTLTLDTSPGGYLVDLSSSSILHNNGNSGGFAQVTGPGPSGGVGFADLTIDPENPIGGFSAIKFKLEIPGALTSSLTIPHGYQTDFFFDTRVFFSVGGFQDFLAVSSADPHRFLITAGSGETISAVTFSNLVGVSTKHNQPTLTGSYNFAGLKQLSFNTSVPEPGTWALMISGFGLAGAALRRRRALTAA